MPSLSIDVLVAKPAKGSDPFLARVELDLDSSKGEVDAATAVAKSVAGQMLAKLGVPSEVTVIYAEGLTELERAAEVAEAMAQEAAGIPLPYATDVLS